MIFILNWIHKTTGNVKLIGEIEHQRYSITYDPEIGTYKILFCEKEDSTRINEIITKGFSIFTFYLKTKFKLFIFSSVLSYLGLTISLLFLFLTILLYSIVPALKTFNGKCIKRYLMILSVAYLATSIVELYKFLNILQCQLCGYTMYYSYLSAFLWLNVICYDLCVSLTLVFLILVCLINVMFQFFPLNFRPSIYFFMTENKRLMLYSLYAWCLPLIATTIVIILQYPVRNPLFRIGNHMFHPIDASYQVFGVTTCLFN